MSTFPILNDRPGSTMGLDRLFTEMLSQMEESFHDHIRPFTRGPICDLVSDSADMTRQSLGPLGRQNFIRFARDFSSPGVPSTLVKFKCEFVVFLCSVRRAKGRKG